jgi:hypothetical protein
MLALPACTTLRGDPAPVERFVPITDMTPEIRAVQDIIIETGDRFGVTPYPEYLIVRPRHEMLGGRMLARAVVYESGREALFIASDQTEDLVRLRWVIEHEMAHFAAWRQFGHNIPTHGTEWRAVCMVNARHSRESCKARG